jgi:DNA-binding transcriptional ArsR family regulator
MPSIFASRNLTFWHKDNNYLFFVSKGSRTSQPLEPSDQLILKTLAFNDKTRLKMLRLLSTDNYNTAEMSEKLNNNPSTISRHFKLFKDAGYVNIFSQEGNFINYSLNHSEIEKSLKEIANYIMGGEESQ